MLPGTVASGEQCAMHHVGIHDEAPAHGGDPTAGMAVSPILNVSYVETRQMRLICYEAASRSAALAPWLTAQDSTSPLTVSLRGCCSEGLQLSVPSCQLAQERRLRGMHVTFRPQIWINWWCGLAGPEKRRHAAAAGGGSGRRSAAQVDAICGLSMLPERARALPCLPCILINRWRA